MAQLAKNENSKSLSIADYSFRFSTSKPIKSLSGFQKHHSLPDNVDAKSEAFVKTLGKKELEVEAERIFQNLRKGFNYRRKEITVDHAEGSCVIHCPDFETSLSLEIDRADPKRYRMLCEISRLHQPSLCRDPRLAEVFPQGFSELLLRPPNSVDIPKLIDCLEEKNHPAAVLDYPSSAEWCELKFSNLGGCLRMTGESLSLIYEEAVSVKQLWDAFQSYGAEIEL